jgi:hypothetical protein
MRGAAFKVLVWAVGVCLALPQASRYSYAAQQYSQAVSLFSDDELDQMLAPIALYPDPLLAQILPAASFVDQVSQAQRMLNGRIDEDLIENQNWDSSVKAIAHYPDILSFLAQQPDWTAAVGQAYVMQRTGVAASIQRLRSSAMADGALQTTRQQQVTDEAGAIRIEPAQPEFIYVPYYDPDEVWGYYPDVYPGGLITFGSGLVIGSWLNRDWDWHGRGPFYHGWSGRGWVDASRRFVDTHNRAYVHDRSANVAVNRNVMNRNISGFRSGLDRKPPVVRAKPAPGNTGHESPSRAGPPGGTGSAVPAAPGRQPGRAAPAAPAVPPHVTPAPKSAAPAPQGREKPGNAAPAPKTAPAAPMTPPRAPAPAPKVPSQPVPAPKPMTPPPPVREVPHTAPVPAVPMPPPRAPAPAPKAPSQPVPAPQPMTPPPVREVPHAAAPPPAPVAPPHVAPAPPPAAHPPQAAPPPRGRM